MDASPTSVILSVNRPSISHVELFSLPWTLSGPPWIYANPFEETNETNDVMIKLDIHRQNKKERKPNPDQVILANEWKSNECHTHSTHREPMYSIMMGDIRTLSRYKRMMGNIDFICSGHDKYLYKSISNSQFLVKSNPVCLGDYPACMVNLMTELRNRVFVDNN